MSRPTDDEPARPSGEIRFHGRGGQGVVSAADLLSVAAFLDGRYAQAFPSFGSERTGAPVQAFCRIGDRPIRTHEPVTAPDVIVVQDATLLADGGLFAGIRPGGLVLVNSSRSIAELGLGWLVDDGGVRAMTVPATDLARRMIGRPVPNTALLGALAQLTGLVSLDSVVRAVRRRFDGQVARTNAATAVVAAACVRSEVTAGHGA